MKLIVLLIALSCPSWGALAFVQASSGGQSGASTTAATGATSTTNGNTLIVFFANPSNCTSAVTWTVTDTAGNTFIQFSVSRIASNSCMRGFIARNITANASNVITGTISASETDVYITAAEFSGVSSTIARDASFAITPFNNDTTISALKVSTFYADSIIVVGARQNVTTGAWTASSGYTIPSNATSPNNVMTLEYKIYSALQTDITITMSVASAANAMCLQGISLIQ